MTHIRALGVVAASLLAWWVSLTLFHRDLIVDEWIHLSVIDHFAKGKEGLAPELPMLPTYHWVAALIYKVSGFSLTAVRAFCATLSFAGIALIALARRDKYVGARLILLGWFPLLYPYVGLTYTEAAAIATVGAGVFFHFRKHYLLSGAFLILACLVRQSNLIWLAYFALLASRGYLVPFKAKVVLGRIWIHLAGMGAAVAWVLAQGQLVKTQDKELAQGFNPAQILIFVLATILLCFPLAYTEGRRLKQVLKHMVRRRFRWILFGAVAISSTGLFPILYDNSHPWNQDLDFLRNYPLLAMDASWGWRFGLSVLAVIGGLWVFGSLRLRMTPRNFAPWILATLVFLLPHRLVEPRYYIIPLMLMLIQIDLPKRATRKLAAWWFVIALAICISVIRNGPFW